ncbi:MAG: hypothetical protein IIC01_05645 [Planctomycetes bacterium]|nr:hypothetical protein [Planctomycetota bacterium]
MPGASEAVAGAGATLHVVVAATPVVATPAEPRVVSAALLEGEALLLVPRALVRIAPVVRAGALVVSAAREGAAPLLMPGAPVHDAPDIRIRALAVGAAREDPASPPMQAAPVRSAPAIRVHAPVVTTEPLGMAAADQPE